MRLKKELHPFPQKNEIFRSIGIEEQPVIALLAGSRRHEIELVLPEMIKVVRHFP